MEGEENKSKDLNVESLDDLFEDENSGEEANDKTESDKHATIENENNIINDNTINASVNSTNKLSEQDEAPVLPQDDEELQDSQRKEEDVMSIDVQKELEAKFDELFGSFDEDEDK